MICVEFGGTITKLFRLEMCRIQRSAFRHSIRNKAIKHNLDHKNIVFIIFNNFFQEKIGSQIMTYATQIY